MSSKIGMVWQHSDIECINKARNLLAIRFTFLASLFKHRKPDSFSALEQAIHAAY